MPITLHRHAVGSVIAGCRVIRRDNPITAERRIQGTVRIESHQTKIVSVDPGRTRDENLPIGLNREPFGEVAAS